MSDITTSPLPDAIAKWWEENEIGLRDPHFRYEACFTAGAEFGRQNPTPDSKVMGKAEAFDRIVAAQKAVIDAVAAYNARLEVVRAERNRGNWSVKVDPEYKAMSDAKSDFTRVVYTEACAALSAASTEGE